MKDTRPMINAAWQETDPRDFTISAENRDSIRERLVEFKPLSDYQYEWNQGWSKKTKSFCTAFAPMCAILSYKEKSWNQETWDWFFDWAAENYGYKAGEGNSILTGVKCAVNFWNEMHPDDPLMYYHLDWDSEDFHFALEQGYRLVVGGGFNYFYQFDRKDDGIINSIKNWLKNRRIYGHALTMIKGSGHEDKYEFIDNYKDRDYNRYLIEKNLLDKTKFDYTNRVGYYNGCYVITSAKELKKKVLPNNKVLLLQALMSATSKIYTSISEDNNVDEEMKPKILEHLHKSNQWYRDNLGL